VNIQLNIVTCPTYADKFIRDIVVSQLSVVIVTCRDRQLRIVGYTLRINPMAMN